MGRICVLIPDRLRLSIPGDVVGSQIYTWFPCRPHDQMELFWILQKGPQAGCHPVQDNSAQFKTILLNGQAQNDIITKNPAHKMFPVSKRTCPLKDRTNLTLWSQ